MVKTLWGGAVLRRGEKLTCGMLRDYLSVWEIGDVEDVEEPHPSPQE